jgi:LPXTG-motif cell wall-anchored protein
MNSKKIVSLFLAISLLFTLNVSAIFAYSPPTYTLNVTHTEGGTVQPTSETFKPEKTCNFNYEHTHGASCCKLSEHQHSIFNGTYNGNTYCGVYVDEGDDRDERSIWCTNDNRWHNHTMIRYTTIKNNFCGTTIGFYIREDNIRWETGKTYCGKNEHTHGDGSCSYCNKKEHQHSEGCYNWGNATITATANTGYYVKSVTGTGQTENTGKATSYTTTFNMNQDREVHVEFEKIPCTVTLTVSPAGGGTVSGGGTYDYGDTLNLTATPATGYEFVGWYIDGEEIELSDYEVTEDITVEGRFQLKEYQVTVSASPSEGGNVSGGGIYTHGSSLDLSYEANPGYEFIGWFIGNKEINVSTYKVTDSVNIVGEFKKIQYLVKVEKRGPSASAWRITGNNQYYDEGTDVTLTVEKLYDFISDSTFKGWYSKEGDILIEEGKTLVLENIERDTTDIYAYFDENPQRVLTVEFNEELSTPGETNAWTVTNISTETIDFSYYGYGTSGDDTLAAGASMIIETEAEANPEQMTIEWTGSKGCTLYDSAWAKMYTFIEVLAKNGVVKDQDGRTVSSNDENNLVRTYYFEGTTVTLAGTPGSGYRFGSWNVLWPEEDIDVTERGNVLDIFIIPHEFGPPAPESVGFTVMNGYYLPAWIEGIRVDAEFESAPAPTPSPRPTPTTYYNLDIKVEGPGSVLPESGRYAEHTLVMLQPKADEGAKFVGWFGANGEEVTTNNGILMNGNKSIIARFETEEIEIVEEEIPESGEIPEEDSTPEESDVPIEEEPIPEGSALPQTGGLPLEIMLGTGFALATGGIFLRRKNKDQEETEEEE